MNWLTFRCYFLQSRALAKGKGAPIALKCDLPHIPSKLPWHRFSSHTKRRDFSRAALLSTGDMDSLLEESGFELSVPCLIIAARPTDDEGPHAIRTGLERWVLFRQDLWFDSRPLRQDANNIN